MDNDRIECVFCARPDDEGTHIDMAINSICVRADCIVEFSDLLRDLLGAKVCLPLKKIILLVMQVMRLNKACLF